MFTVQPTLYMKTKTPVNKGDSRLKKKKKNVFLYPQHKNTDESCQAALA